VDLAQDLSADALAAAMPGRDIRAYPAMMSTGADALAWARTGGPHGAVVVADFQSSPRGRAGMPWEVRAGAGLGFSMVLRPSLPTKREGWLYVVAAAGVADALDEKATIEWPDEVRVGGHRAGAVGVEVDVDGEDLTWAVVSVLVADASAPRAPLLARVVEAIEARACAPTAEVLASYLLRCETIGRRVRARLVPMRPGGPHITGTALRTLADGSLVIDPDDDRGPVAVPPGSLGVLETPEPPSAASSGQPESC
jgi:BirA family biotin operon repressor/biotin-[acetyl-CoA-carboxylase] ligase